MVSLTICPFGKLTFGKVNKCIFFVVIDYTDDSNISSSEDTHEASLLGQLWCYIDLSVCLYWVCLGC